MESTGSTIADTIDTEAEKISCKEWQYLIYIRGDNKEPSGTYRQLLSLGEILMTGAPSLDLRYMGQEGRRRSLGNRKTIGEGLGIHQSTLSLV